MTKEHHGRSGKGVLWSVLLLGAGFSGGYLAFGTGAPLAAPSKMLERGAAILAGAPVLPSFLPAQETFMRLAPSSGSDPKSLDIAVSTYRPLDGEDLEVTLVGAIHIADPKYYQALNEELSHYDTVLYELVAPKNSLPPQARAKGKDPLSAFQDTLSELLEVTHQLDEVDYRRPNFVHADLSMQDLIAEGKRRGETQFTLIAGVALDAFKLVQKAEHEAAQNPGAPTPVESGDLMTLISQPTLLRKQFAAAMAKEDSLAGFTTLNPYLIEARNKAALKVLDEQIQAGKRKIAIFYGAAHLPDFERRLLEDYNMGRTETRWLQAWDMQRELPERNPWQVGMKLFRQLSGIK